MKKQVIDQTAHFVAALAILSLVLWVKHPLACALAGYLMGMIREVTEEGPLVTLATITKAEQSYMDLAFWTGGGLAAGLIAY